MTKTKRFTLNLLIAIVMLLSAFALMGFTTNVSAYADSKTYFSDEKYTESDSLLNSDGSESYNLHSWWSWFVTYDQLRNINNTI